MRSIRNLVAPYKLNVGCGRNILEDCVNIDSASLAGVDIVCNLETLRDRPIDLPDDCAESILLSHVIEHIHDVLGLMQELWRVAKPGALAVVRTPHGASDDAWGDPTHVRPMFTDSFVYFSQPAYWRADYGFRGDWQAERIMLFMDRARTAGLSVEEAWARSRIERNLVREMVCELRAVKPAREPRAELQKAPRIEIVPAD